MFIHTFETTKILTNKEYFELQNELKKDNNWKAENSGMLYFGLSDKGIIIRMHYIKKKDYHTYNITYRISAHILLSSMKLSNLITLFLRKLSCISTFFGLGIIFIITPFLCFVNISIWFLLIGYEVDTIFFFARSIYRFLFYLNNENWSTLSLFSNFTGKCEN